MDLVPLECRERLQNTGITLGIVAVEPEIPGSQIDAMRLHSFDFCVDIQLRCVDVGVQALRIDHAQVSVMTDAKSLEQLCAFGGSALDEVPVSHFPDVKVIDTPDAVRVCCR